jgi:hypothetical protein
MHLEYGPGWAYSHGRHSKKAVTCAIIHGICRKAEKVSIRNDSLTVVSGSYALEVEYKRRRLGCDAGKIMNGERPGAGLARYCNDDGKRNNVTFAPKMDRKKTWGIKVLAGKVIERGDEIFVAYGDTYRWK